MVDDAHRYLGFAFASADLLFELDGEGIVTFALGAAQQVAGVNLDALAGTALRDIVSDEDQGIVDAFLGALEPGDRRGPIRIALKPKAGRRLKRYGALCACRLPQQGSTISCSLTLRAMGSITAEPNGPNGLHSAESFAVLTEAAVKQAAQTGVELNMELVELSGLRDAAGALGQGQAAEAMQKVAAALRAESFDGSSAAELDPERYALLRPKAEPAHRLTERLEKLVNDIGLETVKPAHDSVELDPNHAPDEGLRTLRVALDRFITEGASGVSLSGVVQKTAAEVETLRALVATGDFTLAYQPVVNLTTSEVDHYETFVRLGQADSPARQIHMAEEMDMIQDIDMAVVKAVVQQLLKASNSKLRLAANISARSLMRPAFAEKLLTVMRYAQPARGRLIFEITESAAMGDLQRADALVRGLRRGGAGICLDGFGANASSFDYLRQVAVDAVKIDGRYIPDMAQQGSRNGVLVRHLAGLCRELKITSIAQKVEDRDTVAALHQIGVDCGQGFLFGRPESMPIPPVRGWQMMKAANG
ncbi:MAG TPA: EAL domain-containing protein [Caulobacteraceae bacterium]|jgi:EAL domain-containing protein (putative c-di-GMP-specific phosphodiesterase class I)